MLQDIDANAPDYDHDGFLKAAAIKCYGRGDKPMSDIVMNLDLSIPEPKGNGKLPPDEWWSGRDDYESLPLDAFAPANDNKRGTIWSLMKP